MKIKTQNLSGRALNWFVAQLEDEHIQIADDFIRFGPAQFSEEGIYWPSESWDQAGPIIAREGIMIRKYQTSDHAIIEKRHFDESKGDDIEYLPAFKREMVLRPNVKSDNDGKFMAQIQRNYLSQTTWNVKNHFLSDSSLIAAMRCYVASKMGDSVEVPEELIDK